MVNKLTVEIARAENGFAPEISPIVRFKVDNLDDYTYKVFAGESGRQFVMTLEFTDDEQQNVAVAPWFGGLFWVRAGDLEAAISEAMNFFKCFITGDGQFHKHDV